MSLLSLIFILAVIGVLVWLVNTYVPMASSVRRILNAVVVIIIVLWLIGLFTGGDIGVDEIRVPTIEMQD
jgi:glycerol-3-phosphate acyltransferase PlsY